MTLRASTGLKNFIGNQGSWKHALSSGVLRIYTGAQPTSPDSAVSGSLLLQVTLASGTWTSEVRATGTVTLTGGASGSVDTITVNGVSILASAVAFDTDLATTAAAVATAINDNITSPNYEASSSGAVITIKAMPLTGTGPNAYAVVSGATTITTSDVNLASGVAAVNGLDFGAISAGVLSKGSGVWSGAASATGTAGCFRFAGSEADANATSTTLIRLDGSVGTSGADLNINTTSITSGATHTVDSFSITLPTS